MENDSLKFSFKSFRAIFEDLKNFTGDFDFIELSPVHGIKSEGKKKS